MQNTTEKMFLENLTVITNETEDTFKMFDEKMNQTLTVLFSAIFIVGVAGNILVLLVMGKYQKRNAVNVMICNLAVSDLAFLLICVPFTTVNYGKDKWPFGNEFCKVYNYLIHTTACVSAYTLAILSAERFVAIAYPMWCRYKHTLRHACIACIVVWVTVLLASIPVMYQFGTYEYENSNHEEKIKCVDIRIFKDLPETKAFYITFSIVGFFIPMVTIGGFSYLTVRKLNDGTIMQNAVMSDTDYKQQKGLIKMVTTITVSFCICWLPIHVIFLYRLTVDLQKQSALFGKVYLLSLIISQCLAYMNSCINPILYVVVSKSFRGSVKKVLGCWKKKFRINNKTRETFILK